MDEVRIVLQQDSSAALLQLRAGDLDLITPVAGRDVASVKGNSALSYVESSAQGQLYCLVFNARPGARLAGDDMTITSRPEDTQNAQVYQQMLAKIGVRLTLQPAERVAWVNKTLAGNFEFGSYLSGVRPDPDLALGYRVGTNGSGNYAAWTDPAVDAALEEGRSTYDAARRQSAYETVQLMFDAAYYGFVWRRPGTFAMSSALKGFQTPLQGYFSNSMELWLDR